MERARPEPARDLLGWPQLFNPRMPHECAATVHALRGRLAQDRLDTFHLNEICVCCQGTALDLDELLGLMITLMGNGSSLAAELVLRGVAALPGAYYGGQNYRGGVATGRALGQLSDAVGEDQQRLCAIKTAMPSSAHPVAPMPDLGPVLGAQRSTTALLREQPHDLAKLTSIVREREANLAAQRRAIDLSRSLQHFIEVFDGSVPMLSAALTVAATFAPTLGIIAGALLVVYCFAHAIRYGLWDLRETLAKASSAPRAADSRWGEQGERAFAQLKRHRVGVLGATIASFVGYGVAAAGVTAAALGFGSPAFAAGSLYALIATMGAVLVLNNGPVKDIYGKNSKDRLSRHDLGSEQQIVSLLGRGKTEVDALDELSRRSRTWPGGVTQKMQALARERAVGGLVALGYVTATLGITGIFANEGHAHAHGHDHVDTDAHACTHEHLHAHAAPAAPADNKKIPSWLRLDAVGETLTAGSVALERWMARTLHSLRAHAVRTSPARAAALKTALVALEQVVRQPDGSLPYEIEAAAGDEEGDFTRLVALLGHLKLLGRVQAGAGSLERAPSRAAYRCEFETAAIMALVHERRPELRFALGALADHLHARRRLASLGGDA